MSALEGTAFVVPSPVGVGNFVLVTGQEVELGRAFGEAGGIVCDTAVFEADDPNRLTYRDARIFAVYIYADADVYILPESALTPTTREEALCAATG